MNAWRRVNSLLAMRLDNAGDMIMLGPALRSLRKALPRARIDLLATKAGASAATLLPWIDEVIQVKPIWQELGQTHFDPEHEYELIHLLAGRGYDGALVFTSFSQDPHVPAYVCGMAGIPLRAGQSSEFAGATLTTNVGPLPHEMHQVDRNLALVEAVGFEADGADLEVAIPSGVDAGGILRDMGLSGEEPFVIIHPGASAQARRYWPRRFGQVAHALVSEKMRIVVTGTARESGVVSETVERARAGATAGDIGVRAAPLDMDLAHYAALLKRARAVVCNNTLPLHLADALGTPIVALYSGTDLESQWRPRASPHRLLRRDTPCHPCYLFECPIGKPCLDISPEEVMAAVHEVLSSETRGQAPSS